MLSRHSFDVFVTVRHNLHEHLLHDQSTFLPVYFSICCFDASSFIHSFIHSPMFIEASCMPGIRLPGKI